MMLNDYMIEGINTSNRQKGSLNNRDYLPSFGGSEEPENPSPIFISGQKTNISSISTDYFTVPSESSSGQGGLTLENFESTSAGLLRGVGNFFVQWNPPQYFDYQKIQRGDFEQAFRNILWINQQFIFLPRLEQEKQKQTVLISEEVLCLCSRYRIFAHFQKCLDLIPKHFKGSLNVEVTTECDPEIIDEWVLITIRMHGDLGNILDHYDSYTREFVQTIPLEVQNKIRLIYDLV